MFRSLHMKLVLILVLLIISMMAVVGAFLINGVVSFHLNEFSNRMSSMFSDNLEFVDNLRRAAAEENGGGERLGEVLRAYSGSLGIDSTYRNFYILDGKTCDYITGSDDEGGRRLVTTPNLLKALAGQPGYDRTVNSPYIDAAVPFPGGESGYIVYIKDTKEVVQNLTGELFVIILQSLLFGLLIAVILSFLLSKTMTTSIENLTKRARLMASGEFGGRIELQSRDEIGMLTSAFNDMSLELKQTLEAVESERDKLGALFSHMTDGVMAFTRSGDLIQINPAALRLLHIAAQSEPSYAEVLGKIVPLREALSIKQSGYLERDFSTGELNLKLFIAPFGQDDAEGGVISVIHDNTEQHKLEKTRREFVANVSHELRTPITNIKSYAETLLDSGEDIPQDMEQSFLRVIISESDRMTRIVKDLLTLSRFDYGSMDWRFEPFDFRTVLQGIFEAMYLDASKRGHQMSLEFQDQVGCIVGDKERIEQVIVNIVSNAVKYTPEGGEIDILAGASRGGVWVEVQDTGIGIPKEDMSRLFERFYRVDKARSRESGGTGLGLSIAREIITRHGGTINVRSVENKGTCVRIWLPPEPPEEAEESADEG